MTGASPRPDPVLKASGASHVTGAPAPPGPIGLDPLTAPLTYPGTPPRRPAVLVTDDAVLVLRPQNDAPLGEWLLQGAPEAPSGPGVPTATVSTDARPAIGAKTEVTSADADHGSRRHPDLGHPETHHPDPDRPDSRPSEPRHLEPGYSEPGHRDPGHPRPGHGDASAVEAGSGPDRREIPLDRYLGDTGGSPAASRTPVLAVGSNASPAQLQRKLVNAGLRALVPITAVSVRGLAVGVSAHVSRPGYLPATPIPIPSADAASDLWALWLDEAELAAVDATEPNYDRVLLPDRCPVRLTTGQPVTQCWVYLSRHGYLLNEAREPRRLTDQSTLISALLAEIPALPSLAGASPQEWIERTRDAAVRDAIREVFGSRGLVRRVREL